MKEEEKSKVVEGIREKVLSHLKNSFEDGEELLVLMSSGLDFDDARVKLREKQAELVNENGRLLVYTTTGTGRGETTIHCSECGEFVPSHNVNIRMFEKSGGVVRYEDGFQCDGGEFRIRTLGKVGTNGKVIPKTVALFDLEHRIAENHNPPKHFMEELLEFFEEE